MRTLQITAGAFFLANGLMLMTGRKKLIQRVCALKSRFLPSCYHGTLKEFVDAGPSVYLYWGIHSTVAGGLMILTAVAGRQCKTDT